mmetsp:Transcript_21217/g.59305  ORF Transcript_21217/g.59305 Transcript_21217/m.59305 type:complete len:100 (+) Transcript_21217:88-387(+)
MQIFVRSLDKTLLVDVAADASVNDLKVAIEDREFLPAHLQKIVSGTTALASNCRLKDCIADAGTVELQVGVDGGMRAKWRKKRMRRLRRKRRKMRMRAK